MTLSSDKIIIQLIKLTRNYSNAKKKNSTSKSTNWRTCSKQRQPQILGLSQNIKRKKSYFLSQTWYTLWPSDTLYEHFKELHSAPNISTSPTNRTFIKNDVTKLEESKNIHDYLDYPIEPSEVEAMSKLLGSKKSPGPDKIRNEMLKTGIHYFKNSLCKLFNLILKCGFFLLLGAKGLLLPSINLETKGTHLIIEESVSAVASENF